MSQPQSSLKRPLSYSTPATQQTYKSQPIHISTPIHDRSSTFIAIHSTSPLFLSNPKLLQSYPDFATASHRILAWRRRRTQQQTTLSFSTDGRKGAEGTAAVQFDVGSDEDGETYAGRKVEMVLIAEGVEGVVCVGRWFGGVLLGPVRFKWIEGVVREAVRLAKGDGGVEDGAAVKKLKVIDEEWQKKESARLSKVLSERDGTILVLRRLLGDKMEALQMLERKQVEDASKGTEKDGDALASGTAEADGGASDEKQRKSDDDEPNPPTTTGDTEATTDNARANETTTSQPVKPSTPPNESLRGSTPPSSLPPSVKPPASSLPEYGVMPLDRLKQLEKARDATIGWILKQIDSVEEKIQVKEMKSEIADEAKK